MAMSDLAAPAIGAGTVPPAHSLDWAELTKQSLEAAPPDLPPPLVQLEQASRWLPEDPALQMLRHTRLGDLERLMQSQLPAIVDLAALAQPAGSFPLHNFSRGIAMQEDQAATPVIAAGYHRNADGQYQLAVRLQNPSLGTVLRAREILARHNAAGASLGILRDMAMLLAADPRALYQQPLAMGASIGLAGAGAGSLGAFVTSRNGQEPALLSCSHVLARGGQAALGTDIFHPAPRDAQSGPHPARAIATLARLIDLRAGPCAFDAATARLADPADARHGNRIPQAYAAALPGDSLNTLRTQPLLAGTRIAKVGRTSGLTFGIVENENLGALEIFCGVLGHNVFVSGLTEIGWEDTAFSQDGDSGSVAFLAETMEPLGLLIAGGIATIDGQAEGKSYLCPLGALLAAWDLKLL